MTKNLKIKNWEKEFKQWIFKIYNAHEIPHSYSSMENYYMGKIRQLLKSKKEELLERIEGRIEKLFVKWANEIPYPDPITQAEQLKKQIKND